MWKKMDEKEVINNVRMLKNAKASSVDGVMENILKYEDGLILVWLMIALKYMQ